MITLMYKKPITAVATILVCFSIDYYFLSQLSTPLFRLTGPFIKVSNFYQNRRCWRTSKKWMCRFISGRF